MVDFAALRQKMVDEQLKARDIRDERVLQAMGKVPRHEFVPSHLQHMAYNDNPLPIGEDQTISQPYIVALMTQMLQLQGHERVLEIGTGCGYQTAILCELASYVYSLERFTLLADRASATLAYLHYENLDIHIGDGSQGLPDMEPFEAIIVTAAAPSIPAPLVSQLSPNKGRLIVPVGDSKGQYIYIVQRIGDKNKIKRTIPVRFVPLIGRFGFRNDGNATV